MKSKIARISTELDMEIKRFAEKNNKNLIEASKELAGIMNKIRANNIKLKREIIF